MNNMEIHVGDIVKVKPKDGNGVYPNGRNCEIVDYNKHWNQKYTSGLLETDHKERVYVVRFENIGGGFEYRRVYQSHITEIIQSAYSNIKHTTEDYNYLIPLLTELNTT